VSSLSQTDKYYVIKFFTTYTQKNNQFLDHFRERINADPSLRNFFANLNLDELENDLDDLENGIANKEKLIENFSVLKNLASSPDFKSTNDNTDFDFSGEILFLYQKLDTRRGKPLLEECCKNEDDQYLLKLRRFIGSDFEKQVRDNDLVSFIELKKIEGSDDSSSLAREYNDNANRLTDELLNLEKYLPFDHVLYKYNDIKKHLKKYIEMKKKFDHDRTVLRTECGDAGRKIDSILY